MILIKAIADEHTLNELQLGGVKFSFPRMAGASSLYRRFSMAHFDLNGLPQGRGWEGQEPCLAGISTRLRAGESAVLLGS